MIEGLMAARSWIDDRQWARVRAVLLGWPRRGRPGNDDRRFFEAVVWWRRTGAPWRDLPAEFGPWKTVFNRFDRWSKTGRWADLFKALQRDVDAEWQSIDSTSPANCWQTRPIAAASFARCSMSSVVNP